MDELIVEYEKGIYVSKNDLYDYVKTLEEYYLPFTVYNVSIGELELMKLCLGEITYTDNPIMAYDTIFDRIILNESDEKGNHYFVKRNKLFMIEDNEKIKKYILEYRYSVDCNDFKIYTTETSEDVLTHYSKDNKVLKKVII